MKKIALYLSAAGILFSGYLSATKLFSGGCAFNEPCPYLFGIPACYIGFILYAMLFALAWLQLKDGSNWSFIRGISGVGVLYAGYFTFNEIVSGFSGNYALLLPTCAWGLIFFAVLLGIAIKAKNDR